MEGSPLEELRDPNRRGIHGIFLPDDFVQIILGIHGDTSIFLKNQTSI